MRSRIFLLAAGLVAAVLAAGGSITLAASSTPATIHTCRSNANGAVFLWRGCPKGYSAYVWNVTGPQGVPGRTGPTGPQGIAGTPGPSFADPFTLTLTGHPKRSYTCSVTSANSGNITGITCAGRHA